MRFKHALLGAALVSGSFACGSTAFVSSWKAPGAQPVDPRGSRVAALVLVRDEATREAAEDALAGEITTRGASGVAMHTLLPGELVLDRARARGVLEQAAVRGVVVMRPVQVERDTVQVPITSADPAYGGYWNGYYEHGMQAPWIAAPAATQSMPRTVVSVETLVYSLAQDRLLWSGKSRSTNPENVKQLIAELASAAADELEDLGVVARPE